jgi:hypothetical protein
LFERLQTKEIETCWHALDSRCVSAVRISPALPMAQQIAEQRAVMVPTYDLAVGLDKRVRLTYKFSITSLGSTQKGGKTTMATKKTSKKLKKAKKLESTKPLLRR